MTKRKPHLLRAKQEIVYLIDAKIREKERNLVDDEDRRNLAIFIRQRNIIARGADMKPIPVTQKDLQGKYTVGG